MTVYRPPTVDENGHWVRHTPPPVKKRAPKPKPESKPEPKQAKVLPPPWPHPPTDDELFNPRL